MKKTKAVRDVEEIENTTQDTNEGADETFTEVNSRQRERRNTPPKDKHRHRKVRHGNN